MEAARLIGLIESGEEIRQQTRSFDANNNTTFSIRDKEDADDYRYFADPDLTPFHLEEAFIEKLRASIPVLQEERIKKYTALQLTEYDATVLTEDKAMADYFETILQQGSHPKAAANWMLGPVKSWLNENNKEITEFPVPAVQMARLIQLVENGKLSFTMASSKLFPELLLQPAASPEAIATERNMLQQSDAADIGPVVDAVLVKLADKVAEYKKGKKGLLSLFVGEVMKQTRGKADPKLTNELLLERLKSK